MFTVEKVFTGDLAHRIHNQNVDSQFTENNCKVLKCRRLHGHTFELKVKLCCNDLVDDMVIDYNEMGFIKKLIDDVLDHRTLICRHDPLFTKVLEVVCHAHHIKMATTSTLWNCDQICVDDVSDEDIKEFLSSFTIVPFTTSSENISKWIFDIVNGKINQYNDRNNTNVKVCSVSYKETPKSEAICL